jgi:hypothetical protein
MKRYCFILLAIALVSPTAFAQTKVQTPGGAASGAAIGFGPKDGAWTAVTPSSPLPTAGKQESFALVTANTPSAAATVYGGDYIFAQLAVTYGLIKLQVLGPDNSTWLELVSKTASDANGAGTGLALPSGAQVRAILSGTAGAFATLKRVP